MKILIVVPTYNEKENIQRLAKGIFEHAPSVQVLFVDDNSRDGTKDEILLLMKKRPEQVFMIEREGKLGLGTAYLAGFRWGLERGFEAIFEMDADLSHNPKYLPEMISLLSKYDCVYGSRYVQGGGTLNWGFIRQIISRFGSIYSRLILGTPVNDMTGGFNAWKRRVLERIDLTQVKSEGYAFQIELKHRAYKAGFSYFEFPIIFADREFGQSKMSTKIIREAMIRVWKLKSIGD